MNILPLLNIPCTVTPRAAGTADEYNDETFADGTPVETVCWLHQTASEERLADRDTSTETWTIYLPADTTVDTNTAVTVAGATYEMTGPPAPWIDPRSQAVQFIAASVRKVT